MNHLRTLKTFYTFSKSNQFSGLKLIRKYNQQFYMENFDKCLSQEGFPQATLTINNKEVKLIGVPLFTYGQQPLQEKSQSDLTELLSKEYQSGGQCAMLLQLDPTPYLHLKRTFTSQFIQNQDQIKMKPEEDFLTKFLPLMPITVEELQFDLQLFDLMHLIDQRKGPDFTPQQQEELNSILSKNKAGYFTSFLSNQNRSEQEMEEYHQAFHKITMQSLFYEGDYAVRPTYQQLLMGFYIGISQGSLYLGDLSRIYLRIQQGQVLKLDDLKSVFKEIAALKLINKNTDSPYPWESAQVAWRQLLKDYYLLFNINQILNLTTNQKLIVLVETLHYETLRLALVAQENKLITEIDETYVKIFQFSEQLDKNTDEQMIEKHVLLDLIEGFPIWKEKLIKNPFPYLSQDYTQLSPQDQKEIQKIFFKYHSQYNRVLNQVTKQ